MMVPDDYLCMSEVSNGSHRSTAPEVRASHGVATEDSQEFRDLLLQPPFTFGILPATSFSGPPLQAALRIT